jgi:crossover junction endodeoxyribonuclease RuvC
MTMRRRPHPLPTRVNPAHPKPATTVRPPLRRPNHNRNTTNRHHRRPRHRHPDRRDRTGIKVIPTTVPAMVRVAARGIDWSLVLFVKRRAQSSVAAFLLLQPLRHWQNLLVSITRRQFEQMQERLGGASPRAVSPVFTSALRAAPNAHRVILGVDPSLRGTGFGVIKLAKPFPETLTHGTISCPAGWARSRCLAKISQSLREAIQKHRPTVCVIEGLFYAQNLQTALIMGEARGAAIAAIAEAGLEIFEIAPRKVKQAIVGYGAAQKSAVAKMVQRLLNLPQPPAPDAADALALALAHAQENSRYNLTPLKRI